MEIGVEQIKSQIEAAKSNNQAAFKFLLDRYWNTVYGFQLKRVRDEYEAEDITIETFSKAFDKIGSYDDKFEFSTWLLTISKNIQIDKSRRKNALLYLNTASSSEEQIQKIADHAPSPEGKLIKEQNLAQLLQYIKKLKPQYQQVINLRYFQEMSYSEIAQFLDEPLVNIKVRLLRARKLLADIITTNHID